LAIKEKSIQVGFDKVTKEERLKKPLAEFFKKNNIPACKIIKELSRNPEKEYKIGDLLKADLFKAGDYVDISGISKGKGFSGGMKRWNWHGGPRTHGSMSHRRIGSAGSSTTPGRVWKGHHMPGHLGNVKVTVQKLKVVKSDAENNLLLVKGAVPGANNSYLIIRKAKKK
ncbi:MAG: 50S ribosomal protein L3, partial [Candidatus Omnitrophica bacterium]|nr:50S ribosomal protein L3 [Candidatus Omnitrophota bacterium]